MHFQICKFLMKLINFVITEPSLVCTENNLNPMRVPLNSTRLRNRRSAYLFFEHVAISSLDQIGQAKKKHLGPVAPIVC